MSVRPYQFVPIYRKRIWGNRNLQRLFGRRLPPGARIGESWELADLPGAESVVAHGPETGRTLHALLTERASDLLGPDRRPVQGRFPLLLKLLDANDILSLQVHPDQKAAEELGRPAASKTECWYVVESRGGYIIKGLQPGVSPEQLAEAVQRDPQGAGLLREVVRRVDVAAGGFHYLPAGMVHAIGPGVVVAEVQTPSDTTYRLCDWGRGRSLHVRQALRCVRCDQPDQPPGRSGDVLLRTEHFAVRRVALGPGRHELPAGACTAWMTLAGRATLAWAGSEAEPVVAPGDTVLLPAGLKQPVATVQEAMLCLEVTLP